MYRTDSLHAAGGVLLAPQQRTVRNGSDVGEAFGGRTLNDYQHEVIYGAVGDLLDKLCSGQMSAHRAAVEAGFIGYRIVSSILIKFPTRAPCDDCPKFYC